MRLVEISGYLSQMLNTLISLDQQLFLLINHLPHPPLFVFLARALSGVEQWGLVWLVIASVLIYTEKHHPKLIIDLIAALVLASYLATGVFKEIVGRLRPEFLLKNINVYTYTNDYLSFPSNHTAVAFAGAVVLAKIFPKGAWFLYTLATLIAFSRIYLGVHYPLDVVAGMILGMVVGKVVIKLTIDKHKKIAKTLVLGFILGLLVFPSEVSAKTVMEVKPDNIIIYEDKPVLGIESDLTEEQQATPISLNIAEKILNIAVSGKKLLVAFTQNKDDRGSQAVDAVLVKDNGSKNIQISAENEKVLIKEKFTQALTSLPLMIKQEAGQILAQTPSGAKLISYTPQDAIAEIEKATGVDFSKIPVKLELKDEGVRLVYVFTEKKDKKLFGLIPITADITTTVSAQTGEVESKSSPWFYQILKSLFV